MFTNIIDWTIIIHRNAGQKNTVFRVNYYGITNHDFLAIGYINNKHDLITLLFDDNWECSIVNGIIFLKKINTAQLPSNHPFSPSQDIIAVTIT